MEIDDDAAVLESIRTGQYDESLDKIIEAAHARRKYADWMRGTQLRVGDKVRFNDRCNPRYLIGQTATIAKVMQSWVMLRLDDGPTGRFRSGGNIRTPMGIIDKVP